MNLASGGIWSVNSDSFIKTNVSSQTARRGVDIRTYDRFIQEWTRLSTAASSTLKLDDVLALITDAEDFLRQLWTGRSDPQQLQTEQQQMQQLLRTMFSSLYAYISQQATGEVMFAAPFASAQEIHQQSLQLLDQWSSMVNTMITIDWSGRWKLPSTPAPGQQIEEDAFVQFTRNRSHNALKLRSVVEELQRLLSRQDFQRAQLPEVFIKSGLRQQHIFPSIIPQQLEQSISQVQPQWESACADFDRLLMVSEQQASVLLKARIFSLSDKPQLMMVSPCLDTFQSD